MATAAAVQKLPAGAGSGLSESVSPPARALSSFPTLSADRKAGFFEDFMPPAPAPAAAPPTRAAALVAASHAPSHAHDDEPLSADEEKELRLLQGADAGDASAGAGAEAEAADAIASASDVQERLLQWKRRWRDCKGAPPLVRARSVCSL